MIGKKLDKKFVFSKYIKTCSRCLSNGANFTTRHNRAVRDLLIRPDGMVQIFFSSFVVELRAMTENIKKMKIITQIITKKSEEKL